MIRLRVTAAMALVAAPLCAADKLPPELALVPTDAAAFVSVRADLLTGTGPGKPALFGDLLRQPDVAREVETAMLGFPPSEVERLTVVFPTLPIGERADPLPVVVVTRTKPIDRPALIRRLEARPFPPDRDRGPRADPRVPRRGIVWQARRDLLFCFAGERTILMTAREGVGVLLDMLALNVDPSREAPLAPALAAAEKNALVAGATGQTFRALAGLWPARERDLTALGRASAVTLVAGLEPDFRLTVKADFPDQVTAREGQVALAAMSGWAADAVKELGTGPEKTDAEMSRLLLAALRAAGEPAREGKSVTLTVRMTADEFARASAAATHSAVTRVQAAANRMKSSNNLKQMALAVHNFESTHQQFPFADRPAGVAHPGLSWRVAILPYIEADDLYKQFKLDEPWDSDHNKKLIEKMPKVFAAPPWVEVKPGHTFYRMFDGPGTMSQMKTFADVADGTSNTFLVVEAGEATIWTKPDELEYDPKKPLPKLGGQFADGFNAAMVDGSVRFIRKGTDEKILRALITANGGETATLGKD